MQCKQCPNCRSIGGIYVCCHSSWETISESEISDRRQIKDLNKECDLVNTMVMLIDNFARIAAYNLYRVRYLSRILRKPERDILLMLKGPAQEDILKKVKDLSEKIKRDTNESLDKKKRR